MLGVLRSDTDSVDYEPRTSLADLPRMLDRTRMSGVPVEMAETGRPEPLAAGVELAACAVIQEGLANAVRHAHGAPAKVLLEHTPGRLGIEVRNGPGRELPARAGPDTACRACGNGSSSGVARWRRHRRRTAASGCASNSRPAARSDPGRGRRRPPAGQGGVRGPDPILRGPGVRRRGRQRPRGRRAGPGRAPGRDADGRADAGDERDRRHPADHHRSGDRVDPRAGAHHLRPRRVRLRRAACRGQRLPAQGHRTPTTSSTPSGWSAGETPCSRRPRPGG